MLYISGDAPSGLSDLGLTRLRGSPSARTRVSAPMRRCRYRIRLRCEGRGAGVCFGLRNGELPVCAIQMCGDDSEQWRPWLDECGEGRDGKDDDDTCRGDDENVRSGSDVELLLASRREVGNGRIVALL